MINDVTPSGLPVTARLVGDADTDFLRAVYASTRELELAPLPWSAEEKHRFIAHQFGAQTTAYQKNYPGAEFLILVVNGIDAGRLYLHRRPDEIRIMDIALLPAFRRQGIGSAVVRGVLHEARTSDRRVTIHVEVFNPAMQWYQRLGFREVSRTEVYALMEWRADPPRAETGGAAPAPL